MKIKITESQLKRIVENSLKKSINEDEDWDTEEEAPNWSVFLWPGSGYVLERFDVNADGEEDALDKVTAQIVNDDDRRFFVEVEDVENNPEDYGAEVDDDGYIENDPEEWLYVDATMDGADRPVYLNIENAKIIKINNNNY